MKTHPKCYIYTRVSTAMQVDGYSLDAQKEKLRRYAEFQDMVVVGEYSDEGKSGKSVEGRLEFLKMIQDIESLKDQVSFVLVFNCPVLDAMPQTFLPTCKRCRIAAST